MTEETAKPAAKRPVVDWWFSCGRHYLTVAGYAVVVEGDPIRDHDVFPLLGELSKKCGSRCWDGDAIKAVCAAANKEGTP
jgi:hypothetical protein